MIRFFYKILLIIILISFVSCNKKGYGDISSYSEDGILQTVVAIEAGTSIPFVYDDEGKGFKNYKENGKDKLIEFLPPPFNLGIIPASKNENGYLETLIITQGYKIGTLIKFIPIGSINYTKNQIDKEIILGIPYAEIARVIDVEKISDIRQKYPDILTIIELWLKNNGFENLVWTDKDEAIKLIESRLKANG